MYKAETGGNLFRKDGKSRERDRLDYCVHVSDGGRLNPDWVEWLMGWPSGWTRLSPMRSAAMSFWVRQHGGYGKPWPEETTPRTTEEPAHRGARLKALGNGQVPRAAVMAWQFLSTKRQGDGDENYLC